MNAWGKSDNLNGIPGNGAGISELCRLSENSTKIGNFACWHDGRVSANDWAEVEYQRCQGR
jgi:hypothetical protein